MATIKDTKTKGTVSLSEDLQMCKNHPYDQKQLSVSLAANKRGWEGGANDRKRDATCLPSPRDEKVKRKTTTEKFSSQILYQGVALATKAQRGSLSLGAKGMGGARTAEEGCRGRSSGRGMDGPQEDVLLCMSWMGIFCDVYFFLIIKGMNRQMQMQTQIET